MDKSVFMDKLHRTKKSFSACKNKLHHSRRGNEDKKDYAGDDEDNGGW